jgi:hypothetical protein
VVRRRLLTLEPGFTVERFLAATPLERDSDRKHYAEGLRLAGVVERDAPVEPAASFDSPGIAGNGLHHPDAVVPPVVDSVAGWSAHTVADASQPE